MMQAFKTTVPVLFGYLAIGIPFGLMLIDAGYPWWLAPVMSTVMYAGAGQYMAVGLFAGGASLSAIALSMILINVRHIVYGLSLINSFKNTGRWKPYLIFALTDETYALMTSCPVPPNASAGDFYGCIAVLNHLYWIGGGVIGALAGMLIPFSFKGVDFALTALFAVLLIDQLKRSRDFLPAAVGCGVTVCALIFLPPENVLLVSLAAGIAVLSLLKGGSLVRSAGRGLSEKEKNK